MTTIVFEKSGDSYRSMICMGHAGHKHFHFEKDMVCASISVLVINTINGLEKFTDTKMKVQTNEETGFIRCDFLNVLSPEATVLMDTLVLGLSDISRQYGEKYCLVEFKEV
ncbi:MAG: ribosomal-processing cysteine protease Prp [Lachnospiraceae bacterium]|nr:ribosomal-processing cysteine protease Prp [Lachnospiraceae bacterium]